MAAAPGELEAVAVLAALTVLVAALDLLWVLRHRGSLSHAEGMLALLVSGPALAAITNFLAGFVLIRSRFFLLDLQIMIRIAWTKSLVLWFVRSFLNFEGPAGRAEAVEQTAHALDAAMLPPVTARLPPCIWPCTGLKITATGSWLVKCVRCVDLYVALWIAVAVARQICASYGLLSPELFVDSAKSADLWLELGGVLATLFGLAGVMPLAQIQLRLALPDKKPMLRARTGAILVWVLIVGLILPVPLQRFAFVVEHVYTFAGALLLAAQLVCHVTFVPPFGLRLPAPRLEDGGLAVSLPPTKWAEALHSGPPSDPEVATVPVGPKTRA